MVECNRCCCRDQTKNEVQQVRLKEDRGCTDILFFLLYIFSWGAFLLNWKWCSENGANPEKIIKGVDYMGRICGVDVGVEDKPIAAWPRPLNPEVKICVSDCSSTDNPLNPYMIWPHPSTPYLGYCLPFPNGTIDIEINITMTGDFNDWFNEVGQVFFRSIGDIETCLEVICLSAAFSLVISYGYVEALRCIAGILIAFCTALLTISAVALGYMCWYFSSRVAEDAFMAEERAVGLEVMAYVLWVGAGIFLVVMLFLRQQIQIAIEVVKEAARALSDMKMLLFTPVVPLVSVTFYFALWLWVGLHVFSVSTLETEPMPEGLLTNLLGQPTPYSLGNATLSRFTLKQEQVYVSGAIHIFCGAWTLQFIIYLLYATIAGALAEWYFTERDEENHKLDLPSSPILRACWRTLRYHTGTVALAAMLIAIVQTIRAMIKYTEMKLKNGGNPSTIATAMLKIISCCLWWVECCLDKINKNGLVWTAIYGDNFCTSSCSAFALIWRNLARLAAVNTVSTILLTIGKLVVALFTGLLFGAGLYYSPWFSVRISSPMFPTIVITILAYFVARLFMAVFETLIDATFFCFLVDAENNPKGLMLAHPALQKLVGKYAAKSKHEATVMKMTIDECERASEMDTPPSSRRSLSGIELTDMDAELFDNPSAGPVLNSPGSRGDDYDSGKEKKKKKKKRKKKNHDSVG